MKSISQTLTLAFGFALLFLSASVVRVDASVLYEFEQTDLRQGGTFYCGFEGLTAGYLSGYLGGGEFDFYSACHYHQGLQNKPAETRTSDEEAALRTFRENLPYDLWGGGEFDGLFKLYAGRRYILRTDSGPFDGVVMFTDCCFFPDAFDWVIPPFSLFDEVLSDSGEVLDYTHPIWGLRYWDDDERAWGGLTIYIFNFNRSVSRIWLEEQVAVSEPGTLALLGAGFMGLAAVRRREFGAAAILARRTSARREGGRVQ